MNSVVKLAVVKKLATKERTAKAGMGAMILEYQGLPDTQVQFQMFLFLIVW